MKSKKYILLLFLYVMSGLPVSGQTKMFSIAGNIKDSMQQTPLNYASVILLYNDTKLQKATHTFANGAFDLKNIPQGSYTLTVTYIGYKTQRVELFITDKDIILPDIFLATFKTTMINVIVTARKPVIYQEDDKIVFSVENDPAAKTETAIDILRKTPFVSVDGDNNIRVNGQANFKVLLNGRETAMFAQNVKEALKTFPGAIIIKVEVITSPSAKYEGEGVGGIINIITKKNIGGYNASVYMYVNTLKDKGGAASVNAKMQKIGITAYYSYNKTDKLLSKNISETVPLFPSAYSNRIQRSDRINDYWDNNANLELSWDMDSLTTLVFYGNLANGHANNMTRQKIITRITGQPNPLLNDYDYQSQDSYPSVSTGLDFIKNFKKDREKELNLKFYQESYRNNSASTSIYYDTAANRYVLNNNNEESNRYTAQADLIIPSKNKHKIETGIKANFRRAEAAFNSSVKYNPNASYIPDLSNADTINYSQNIYSAYFTYGFKIKKNSLRLGIRAEHTAIDGNFIQSLNSVKQNYTTILPNLLVTFRLSKAFTMVIGYNKRLERPYIGNLNPFINNTDSLNISYGNPALAPQTLHNFSLQNRIIKGRFFLGFTFSAIYSNNMIVQHSDFDKTSGVTSTSSANSGKLLTLAAIGSLNAKLTPNWTLNLNGELRYNHLRYQLPPFELYKGTGSNFSLNTYVTVAKIISLSAALGFQKLAPISQVQRGRQYWYSMGLSSKILKEKLILSAKLSSFLEKEYNYTEVLNAASFSTSTINTVPFRNFILSAFLNFGKLKENVSKKKGIEGDDVIEQKKH